VVGLKAEVYVYKLFIDGTMVRAVCVSVSVGGCECVCVCVSVCLGGWVGIGLLAPRMTWGCRACMESGARL